MSSSDEGYEPHVDDRDMPDSDGSEYESDSANNDPEHLATYTEPLGLEQAVVLHLSCRSRPGTVEGEGQ